MDASEYKYKLKSGRKSSKHIFDDFDGNSIYSNAQYGLPKNLTGLGVKISIIDTGTPDHDNIKNISDSIDVTDSERGSKDTHGHSTMISGIIGSKGKIEGLSPNAELIYAKVANTTGKCSYNCIVSGVLWSIIKKADIILLSLGSSADLPILHDSIIKAYESNICVIAAAGKNTQSVDYPACYPEVLSVGKRNNTSKVNKFTSKDEIDLQVKLPGTDIHTTYINNKYTKASGTSLSAAIAAGLAANIIEKFRKDRKRCSPSAVYGELSKLSYNPSTK